jgi:hypothetical protein
MQEMRREESSGRPKVVKVTAQTLAALFKKGRSGSLVPATLVVTDAGEHIVRTTPVLPAALEC